MQLFQPMILCTLICATYLHSSADPNHPSTYTTHRPAALAALVRSPTFPKDFANVPPQPSPQSPASANVSPVTSSWTEYFFPSPTTSPATAAPARLAAEQKAIAERKQRENKAG